MTNSVSPEPVDLSDPSISPHQLQELAQTHPEQWDEILDHPNIYPGLADWIRDRQAELAATGGEEPADQPDVETDEHPAQTETSDVDETEAEDEQPTWALPDASQPEQVPPTTTDTSSVPTTSWTQSGQ